MKLSVAEESRFKEFSQKLNMPFAAVVQGYVIEAVLQQLEKCSYQDILWLCGKGRIGRKAYENHLAGRLEFYYVENKRKPILGLSEHLLSEMTGELFPEANKQKIQWEIAECQMWETEAIVHVTGLLEEMSVPLELRFRTITAERIAPQTLHMTSLLNPEKKITILAYPAENLLAEHFIEIMTKLELISDMGSYARVNEILKEQSVGGRTMMELLEEQAGLQPSFRKEKRLEQLEGYQNYGYMRKRWEKYRNHQKQEMDGWDEVMQRLLNFARPVWTAFCRNEIFLDDWMPELGRFLM